MRKLIVRGVLALLTVVVFSSAASASPILIGTFSWEERDPGQGFFTVLNETGLGVPGYPQQQLTFTGLNVLVTDGNGSFNINQAGLTALVGGSYDSPMFDLNVPALVPRSLVLTGNILEAGFTINGLPYVLNSQAIFTHDSPFLTNLAPDGQLGDGTPLGSFDAEYIYVDADRAQSAVPEPATMLLLGSGTLGLIARRRKVARKA